MLPANAASRGSSFKSSMQGGADGGATLAVWHGCCGLESLASTSCSFMEVRLAHVFALLELLQPISSLTTAVRASRRCSLEYAGACVPEVMAQSIS